MLMEAERGLGAGHTLSRCGCGAIGASVCNPVQMCTPQPRVIAPGPMSLGAYAWADWLFWLSAVEM